MKKRIFSLLLAFLFCFLTAAVLALPASAVEFPSADECRSAVLYHEENDKVMTSKEENVTVAAGAASKFVSGYLFCTELSERFDETVTITEEMLEGAGGYMLKLSPGDRLSVLNLLHGAVIGGYNDCYTALAAVLSGSQNKFVAFANEKIKELGLEATHVTDASGVRGGSTTTASDMLKMARIAYRCDLFMELCTSKSAPMPAIQKKESGTVYNRNALISNAFTTQYFSKYAKGMCAGESDDGGNSVITVAENNGNTYFCVVLGGTVTAEKSYGYVVCNRLVDFVMKSYAFREVMKADTELTYLPVNVSDLSRKVTVGVRESLSAYLPKNVKDEEIKVSLRLAVDELDAPVPEGRQVGMVAILYDGETVASAPLVTMQEIKKGSFSTVMGAVRDFLSDRGCLAGTLFFLGFLCFFIYFDNYTAIRRRRMVEKLENGGNDTETRENGKGK